MKKFYLTTAIDYANGSPHLGHAYEKILTDVIARSMRLDGKEVHFLTGLDEHGQKVQQGAKKEGIDPQERCDGIASEFNRMLSNLDISNDDYIRTTEERHKKVVRAILQELFEKGKYIKTNTKGSIPLGRSNFFRKKIKLMANGPRYLERSQKLPRRIISSNWENTKIG